MRIRRPTVCFLWFLIVLGPLRIASAGLLTHTGEEPEFWTTHSVIFAEVIEVEKLPSDEFRQGSHRLQVRPKATLTGNFDSARMPNLELGAWFVAFDCTCLSPPAKGRYIVAVIQKQDGDYFVEASLLTFMPKGAGLVEVKDFSDPLVAEVMNNLQVLRRRFPFLEVRGG